MRGWLLLLAVVAVAAWWRRSEKHAPFVAVIHGASSPHEVLMYAPQENDRSELARVLRALGFTTPGAPITARDIEIVRVRDALRRGRW
jgi:hypothetical protein